MGAGHTYVDLICLILLVNVLQIQTVPKTKSEYIYMHTKTKLLVAIKAHQEMLENKQTKKHSDMCNLG